MLEGDGGAEQLGEAAGPGEGVVDQRADEGVLRRRRQDSSRRRRVGTGAAEAGIDRELEGAPLEEDAPGVAGIAEAHLGAGAGRDVHLLLLQVRHRRLEVLDLQRDGVHAAPETRDELGRGALDDRLADLDGVVAGPRHPAPPPDARLVRLAVFEHRQSDQDAEVPDGQVVVGHHGGGVEEPPDVVPPPCGGPAHRPAVTGSSIPVMLRAPGPARKTTAAATSTGSTWRRNAAPAAMRADTSSALSPVRVAMDSDHGTERLRPS